MGKFSRSKGCREERHLAHYLRTLGYDSSRVPLSGAMEGYKFDVTAAKGDTRFQFELKTSANKFRMVYDLFDKHCNTDKIMLFHLEGVIVMISPDFEQMLKSLSGVLFQTVDTTNLTKAELRSYRAITSMRKHLVKPTGEKADFLVIKNNHKPLLFLRYW